MGLFCFRSTTLLTIYFRIGARRGIIALTAERTALILASVPALIIGPAQEEEDPYGRQTGLARLEPARLLRVGRPQRSGELGVRPDGVCAQPPAGTVRRIRPP